MIQLRLRTEYSFGKAYAPIDRIIERLKAIGCTAAGIVDIDSTWGHYEFFTKCEKNGIQPLLGIDLVVTDDEDKLPRMWFLAKNELGMRELYNFSSRAFLQNIASKRGEIPRLYTTDVMLMSNNIFKFSGDVVDMDFIRKCGAIIDISPSGRIINNIKRNMAEDNNWPTVNTSDNSYCFPNDKSIFEFCSNAIIKPTPQYILDNIEDTPIAIEIARQCAGLVMPKAKMVRSEGNLTELCNEGIKKRSNRLQWNEKYQERLDYELDLIKEKDFESYFLIVADMVSYAKKHMLVGPSRGSAAGSLVCYISGITEVDPIEHKLYFERFIDINRTDLPDIDLDFPDDKRHIVFEYMTKKYGAENVGHIGTIMRYKPKSALVQICKKLGIPQEATKAVKIAMIDRSSADSRAYNCLEDTLETTDIGKSFIRAYPQARNAQYLEGHASHTGTHAAGLLVCNEAISDFCTITNKGIAQLDKHALQNLGLLKIDVLGLTTLTILEGAGVPIDWYNMQFDDPKVFELFNSQKLCGIFQFEGDAMRSVCEQMRIDNLKDIDAVTALARPGPFGGGVTKEYIERKKGKKYDAIHALVEAQMSESYGLPIYQEQTLSIVREIGKFSWKETSVIRKTMSKSMGVEFFDRYWESFKEGAASQGINEREALKTWKMINSSGAWQMNMSHTRSYAIISYWTAYLKSHHPLEFAASNLRNAKNEEKSIELLREMSKEGIEYVAFDPYLSEKDWCVKDGKLIAGVISLYGFGESKANKFIEKRNAGLLTQKDIDDANSRNSVFGDIFPMKTLYSDIYDNPKKHGIIGKVSKIEDLDGEAGSYVLLGELIYKSARNANEAVLIKKRNGKILTGPLNYLDIRIRDDTGQILCRIDRFKFNSIGRDLLEKVQLGTHILVRGNMKDNIRFVFITKWKLINKEA